MRKPDSIGRTIKAKSIPVHLTAFHFVNDRPAVTLSYSYRSLYVRREMHIHAFSRFEPCLLYEGGIFFRRAKALSAVLSAEVPDQLEYNFPALPGFLFSFH